MTCPKCGSDATEVKPAPWPQMKTYEPCGCPQYADEAEFKDWVLRNLS